MDMDVTLGHGSSSQKRGNDCDNDDECGHTRGNGSNALLNISEAIHLPCCRRPSLGFDCFEGLGLESRPLFYGCPVSWRRSNRLTRVRQCRRRHCCLLLTLEPSPYLALVEANSAAQLAGGAHLSACCRAS